MAYIGSFSPGLSEPVSPTFEPNDLNHEESSSSFDRSGGPWFIICFFGIIVSIVIYHWYRLLTEGKEESSGQDVAMGSYYNHLSFRASFALRRNALRNNARNGILHM
jgi:hypothetical protein